MAVFSVCLHAQEDDEFTRVVGTVYGDSIPLRDAYIKNITSGNYTISTPSGNFTLEVKVGDTLRVVYMGMKDKVQAVLSSHIEKQFIGIYMVTEPEELTDVVVEQQTIDEVTLGIVSEKTPRKTKGERLLKAAGDFKPIHLVGIVAGGMPLDPILNAISGRTKKLKKRVELERDGSDLDELYEKYYVFSTLTLKVPEDEVMQFMYYVIDADKGEMILKAEESLAEFYLTEAYQSYKANKQE
ncbi:hypothetical protein [Neptunitalea lumnitzerae]|uniref:Uncharacterized protein n=1 Tax=Neptunitalea lumnitzerae TaxID=2965509 RepID=A0ABQ5MNH0_9FLAO|nr:hypothetical protein [Neptunitalea sp. Y10]GLB50898.1 hypothetical protein Y10_32660 [Neptunitalea sp. Y10]